MKYFYIYKITNVLNGKSYVGQRMTTRNPENDSYFGSGKYLMRAIKEHGKENFVKEIIFSCLSEDYLNEAEEFFIRELRTHVFEGGYNILLKPVGGTAGKCWTLSEETRRKQTAARNQHGPLSEEARLRMSEAAKGRTISEEVKQRISEKLKGRKHSEEAHQKTAEKNRGKKRSPESRQRMAEAQRRRFASGGIQ